MRPVLNIIALVLALAASAAAQDYNKQTDQQIEALQSSGGTFTLTKSVIAGGGREMSEAQINLHGTAGQTNAGIQSVGGQFSLYSGFWTPEEFAPTAANVVVSGRVLTANGRGIRNVQITVTFPTGETRATRSSSFGYYRFADIPAGDTYIFSVSAKNYVFDQPIQIRNPGDDTQDVDFVAAP